MQLLQVLNALIMSPYRFAKASKHMQLLQVLNALTMSPYRLFAKASKRSDLPDPSGPPSVSISPAAIKEANDAVKSVTSEGKSKWRGSYIKFTPEQQAAINWKICLSTQQLSVYLALLKAAERSN